MLLLHVLSTHLVFSTLEVVIYGNNNLSSTNLRNKMTDVRKVEAVKTLNKYYI